MSPDQEAALQLDIAKENNRLGLDNARIAGNSDIADRVTTDIASAALSDMGEYGKAAKLIWDSIYNGESFASLLGVNANQTLERKMIEWLGQAAATGDSDVSDYEVVAGYRALKSPTRKTKDVILEIKESYSNSNIEALARAFGAVLRAELNNANITLIQ